MLVAACRLDLRPREKIPRLLHHKRTVHQQQRLLRHGGVKTLLTRCVRTGKIKCSKNPREVRAFDEGIDGAPRRKWFRGDIDSMSADRLVEFAAEGEQRIAHRLEIEPAAVH